MGSGPLRAHARVEKELFAKLGYAERAERGVLVLETRTLPTDEVAAWVGQKAALAPSRPRTSAARARARPSAPPRRPPRPWAVCSSRARARRPRPARRSRAWQTAPSRPSRERATAPNPSRSTSPPGSPSRHIEIGRAHV